MKSRTQAWVIIVCSFLFLGILLLAKIFVTPRERCDPSVKSKTVILIDHSEEVANQTIEAIVERTWKFVEENIPDGELVSVFTLSQLSKKDFKASFSACKPRKEGNQTTEDVKKLKRDFEAKFKAPLRAELSTTIKGSNESPIAQALIDLTLDDKHFRSPDLTRLLVYSDLLEHTNKFSLYKCSNAAAAVKQFRESRIGAAERPTFKNTQVRLNIIPRQSIGRPALQCRDAFWVWFFGDMQGDCKSNVCVIPDYLPG